MARSNHVVIKGDITSDIYYDVFTQSGKPLQFLRVHLMINGAADAKEVKGLRVVCYGYLAESAEAHLQTGSRILVEGHIQVRKAPNGNLIFEVVAEDVEYLRNITWERGQKKLEEMAANGRGRQDKTSLAALLPDFPDEIPGLGT